jgi:DNA-binding NarL/FixJ family response regulator
MLEEQGSAVVEARNGEIAVETAANVVPDVVLIDLHMPGMSGVEATRSITAAEPSARIVMLTVSADEQDVLDAVLAGACGYLLKDAPVEDVVRPPSTPSGVGWPDRARAAGAPARRPGGGR